MHIFVEGVLKLNDLRTLNPPSDPSSTGARHNDPARIPLGHIARELATAVVLEGKGMEVGEEGHTGLILAIRQTGMRGLSIHMEWHAVFAATAA